MRIRTTAPETADINFLVLTSLEVLPQLQQYVSACDELSQLIHDLEHSLPRLKERLAGLWRGFHSASSGSLGGQLSEPPELTESRAEIAELESQRKVLMDNAGIARAELALATAQLIEQLRANMHEQLGPPLTALIHGLESVTAIERLVGQVQGHGPARQTVRTILAYLQAVRGQLEGK